MRVSVVTGFSVTYANNFPGVMGTGFRGRDGFPGGRALVSEDVRTYFRVYTRRFMGLRVRVFGVMGTDFGRTERINACMIEISRLKLTHGTPPPPPPPT